MHKLSSKIVPAAKMFLIQKQCDELKFVSCLLSAHTTCRWLWILVDSPLVFPRFLNQLCMNRFSYSLGVASDLCALLC